MCLGVPAKVISISNAESSLIPAKVDFGGICKTISLCFTPEASIGDYVLVHVGFAISIIDEAHANELLEFLDNEHNFKNEIHN